MYSKSEGKDINIGGICTEKFSMGEVVLEEADPGRDYRGGGRQSPEICGTMTEHQMVTRQVRVCGSRSDASGTS